MKKVKYLAMLLAAGMFAACSDNLEDTGAGNGLPHVATIWKTQAQEMWVGL